MLCALLLAALLLPGSALAQAPQPVPPLTARLIDQTGTLSPDDARAIEDRLRSIEQKSGSQVVVLMVATTAPEDIAAYAWRVASDWKIGRRDVGDGLLMVIAKNDRRMRLEVARALEGAIPDLAAARIIDQQMTPRFRQGDYAGGIAAALDQVAARIAGEQLPAPSPNAPSSKSPDRGFDMEDLMLFFFFGVVIAGPILRSMLGRPLASVLAGTGAGIAAYVVTASLLVAGGAGIVAPAGVAVDGAEGVATAVVLAEAADEAVAAEASAPGEAAVLGAAAPRGVGEMAAAITGFVQRLVRLLRHHWAEGQLRRALPPETLAELERLITMSEQRHTGQIRICVEPGLPPSYIWRDATPRERAITLFGKLRVWDTEHNNGALIYLLLADHAIEIVADRALARTLPAQQWQTLISDMQAAFQGGHYAMGMTAALERVSLLLETNFPRDPLQPVHEGGDNLPDTVVIQRH